MTPHVNGARLVLFARVLRVGVDLFVLVAGLLLLLWAFSLSNLTHWAQTAQRHTTATQLHAANQHSKQGASPEDEQHSAAWLKGQHQDEIQAWRTFEQWLHAGQFTSGQCSLSGLKHSADKAIELNCVGGKRASQTEQINLEIDALNLIIAKPARSQSAPPVQQRGPNPPSTEATSAHVVQGWIELPSGTRHFNNQLKRWQP